ncbi:MAG: phosphate/phosphite/phosphonate ABC transporter substrate-binding protein, partial [Elusimicrobiota bacterium]
MTTKKNMAVFLLAAALCITARAHALGEVYRFGIVPQQKLEILTTLWPPLLAEVSRLSGVTLQFETAPSISMFAARCREGTYDFIYTNPYLYVKEAQPAGYAAIARENIRLQGVLVALRASPLRDIKDLKGLRLAFPSPEAYAATLLNKEALAAAGLELERDNMVVSYLGSQDAAYDAVLQGLADAAGGVPRTFDLLPDALRSRLRVLHRTRSGVPHAIAAHRRVPRQEAQKVAGALAALSSSDGGRLILKALGMKRLIRAADADWNEL